MKHYQVSVCPGEFGYHARVEGAKKLWKTSKESPREAVRAVVAEHIFPLALDDAEAAKGNAVIRTREIAENLWHVETDVDHQALGGSITLQEEARGDSAVVSQVDASKVDRGIVKNTIRKLTPKPKPATHVTQAQVKKGKAASRR